MKLERYDADTAEEIEVDSIEFFNHLRYWEINREGYPADNPKAGRASAMRATLIALEKGGYIDTAERQELIDIIDRVCQ